MTEAERSIAVKRKVAVTRPISRDDSPSEVYSPKRKRSEASQEEASPPPYIPSRKDSIGRHGSGGSSLRSERGLSHDDARHTLSREDRRELISKSRREELLRTIGIDRKSSHRLESSGSPEKGRRRSDEDKNMNIRFEREVKSDRKLGGIKNFQITTRVLPQKVLSSHDVEMSRQGSVSPELKQSVQVTVSPRSVANSKASITARLGKVVVERRDSAESEEAEEDQDSRSATLKSKSDQRDAREDINAKAALSKAQNSTLYKSGARSISRLAKEAVQKQCEAAVMSVRASRISDKGKGHMSPDSREVQYDTDSLGSREDEQEEDVKKKEKMDVQVKSGMPRDISGSVSRPKDNESGDEDETEDLDKMIDDDLAPELLEDTANDEFTLDLDDEDLSNVVGAIEEEAVQADMQENEKADQSKPGTRFIVTLDGVDERQFDSVDSAFEKFRQSPLGLAAPGLPVASVSAAIPEQLEQNQKLFLDLLASQGRAIPPTLIQQAQISASTTSSKLTPPKIQPFSISLKDSDDEHDDKEAKQSTSASRQGSYHQAQGEEELEMSALKRARMSERCKFWPACAAGTSCEYHHPTTHCKTFPNCKFGDKCLFIHPNCRFDSKCARPDCPYTHTSRRSNLGSTAHVIAIPQSHVFFTPTPPKPPYGSYLASGYSSAQTVCRYFPNCHNLTCPFLHPKPCRFGSACKSAACPFYHPPVPTKDKLKWQAQSVAPKGQTAAFLGHVKMEPGVSKLASTPVQSSSTTVSSTSQ